MTQLIAVLILTTSAPILSKAYVSLIKLSRQWPQLVLLCILAPIGVLRFNLNLGNSSFRPLLFSPRANRKEAPHHFGTFIAQLTSIHVMVR